MRQRFRLGVSLAFRGRCKPAFVGSPEDVALHPVRLSPGGLPLPNYNSPLSPPLAPGSAHHSCLGDLLLFPVRYSLAKARPPRSSRTRGPSRDCISCGWVHGSARFGPEGAAPTFHRLRGVQVSFAPVLAHLLRGNPLNPRCHTVFPLRFFQFPAPISRVYPARNRSIAITILHHPHKIPPSFSEPFL